MCKPATKVQCYKILCSGDIVLGCGVKESHKRETPFELSLEIKAGSLAGGKGWAGSFSRGNSRSKDQRGEVPGGT